MMNFIMYEKLKPKKKFYLLIFLIQRIYLIVDIFQAIFADLSPIEAYDFADTRNNLSGEPLLFTQPDFV